MLTTILIFADERPKVGHSGMLVEVTVFGQEKLFETLSSIVGENGCPYRLQNAGFSSQHFGVNEWNGQKMLEQVRQNVGAGLEPIRSQHFSGDAFSVQI